MLITQSTLSFPQLCLGTLLSVMLLAIMERILLGLIAALAIPTYLLLHASTRLHHKEFFIPAEGWQKTASDFCGMIVFVSCYQIFFLLIQTVTKREADFLTVFQTNVSNAQAYVTIAMFTVVCLLSWSDNKVDVKAEESISIRRNKWFDKMRAIKLPPPFDWL
ncbi:MAG: hypothetical protein ACRYF0_09730 [Janthinobacterium lividum]